MRDRCIWKFPNVSTKLQRKGWYSREWTGHPAKMPSYLARTIIEIYTRPGDIILDPMSGFFTTGIEAGRLGRRCIGIEFERKYVDSVRRSIQVAQNDLSLFETFTRPLIIHGDARALPLKSADVVMTSPPFGGQVQHKTNYLGEQKGESGFEYSDDPDNIGNLPRGSIAGVVMSPPYSQIGQKADEDPQNILDREGRRQKEYPQRPHPVMYSGDRNNIGNLPHGSIAAVVTSPPYGDDPTGGAWVENQEDPEWRCGHRDPSKRYGDDKANICNLRYVDACVFSPAYGNRLSDQRVRDDDPQRMSYRQSLASPAAEKLSMEKGIPPVTYSPDRDNIGSQKGETYLSAMLQVYRECFRVLRPGGRLVLVLKNFVRDMKIVRLDLDTRTLCEAVGFRMLPCPEGCEDRGHTHLRVIGRHSFWIRNLVNKFYAMEGLVALGYEREELAKDTEYFKGLVSTIFRSAKTKGMTSAVISTVREKIEDWEPPSCPYEQASKYEQIQVYVKG